MQAIKYLQREKTMKAKHLVLTLTLALAAGAAVAAIGYGRAEPTTALPVAEACPTAIPRVVVSASRTQVAEAPIARIVIVGHRADAGQVIAQSN
jgi:hypothetical protein